MDETMYDLFADVDGSHWWFEGRRQVVAAVIGQHLPLEIEPVQSRPQIVDIGCGSGAMLKMLDQFGDVTGLEMFEDAVAWSRSHYGGFADVELARIPDDLPRDGRYDIACAFDVIEHIEDDSGAVERIREAVRPGGLFVSTVPAFPSLWGDTDVLSHHWRRYRRGPYCQVLRRAGFEIDRATYFNTWLFPPAAAVRWTKRLLRRSGREPRADLDLPTGPMDRVLTRIFASERHVVTRWSFPVGVSLLVIARRPNEEPS